MTATEPTFTKLALAEQLFTSKELLTEFHENPSLFSCWYWLIDGRAHVLGLRMSLFYL